MCVWVGRLYSLLLYVVLCVLFFNQFITFMYKTNKLGGFRPQSELYQPSDRRLSAKLVPTLVDRECHVVSATNPHGR
jgi:hypothetical protein